MEIQSNQVIGEIVAHDYRTATVFKKHNIDFCCNGNRSIAEACSKDGIETAGLIAELENVTTGNAKQADDFMSWPADKLATYIEEKHHRYVEQKTSEIIPFLDKLCRVHGTRHPELHQVMEQFQIMTGELAMHMKKEELILFPFIKRMVKAQKEGSGVVAPPFGNVSNPIQSMMHEHDTEGERFRKIAALTNNYNPPADGCTTYRVTFYMLKEFQDDLHMHIHLENNILFPKAIALEKQLS